MTDLDKARVWAECTAGLAHLKSEEIQAAARLIQSLPDQWVSTEKVREVISGQLSFYTRGTVSHYIAEEITGNLKALITPKLPTLADMTAEEREACRWMQAKITDSDQTHVIAIPESTGAFLWSKDGHVVRRDNDRITPLPDLPKLEWPGNEVVEPPALPEGMRLADHEEYGRVVVSPKDDLDGDYRVFCPQDNTEYGANWWYAHKSELTFLGGDQHA